MVTFHEDWFGEKAREALAELAGRVLDLDGRIVEVGCWEGRSTVVLANAVAPAIVDAVDTWAGSPGEISETLAAQRDIYAQFIINISALTAGNVVSHLCDWRDYFVADRSPIRFLFIDAAHTFDEVAGNISAALPIMVSGGIVCGDDAHHGPVIDAARDQLGAVAVMDTLWYKEIV